MTRALLLVLCLLAFAGDGFVHAAEPSPSLLEFELRSLDEPEVHSLTRFAGKPLLMLFFEPDCNWCLRQVRAVNKLSTTCDGDFAAIAVGTGGSRAELKRELRRSRPAFPAYQVSPRLFDALGGIEATPLILVGGADGAFVTHVRGYTPAESLLETLNAALGLACSQDSGR